MKEQSSVASGGLGVLGVLTILFVVLKLLHVTPAFYLCRPLAERLLKKGYHLEEVPGFYQKDGRWTVLFSSRTAGILIPVRSLDRQICGCQIRLDTPLKNEDDPPEKSGAKYIWLSSSGKPKGTSSGSPVHFVGDSNAGVVYVSVYPRLITALNTRNLKTIF